MPTKVTNSFDMNRYLRLVRMFPLVPITSKKHLTVAVDVINKLLDKDRSSAEDAYLDVISDLVERYEDKVYPIEPLEDRDMLEHLLDSKGATQAELARGAGIAESTVSEVLHGKRKLTRKQIGKVADFFNVRPDLFDPRG